MDAPQSSDPANALVDLVDGHRLTAVIYVAARLGIADLLFEDPKSVQELARLTDTHERSRISRLSIFSVALVLTIGVWGCSKTHTVSGPSSCLPTTHAVIGEIGLCERHPECCRGSKPPSSPGPVVPSSAATPHPTPSPSQ